MTIATRNRFIRLATLFSFAMAIAALASIVLMLLHHGLPESLPGKRPFAALETLSLTHWSPLATVAAIGVLPVFSLGCLLYILFAFEKTQTVEITFFAACACVISLEALRIFVPLYGLWTYANFFTVAISRAALFARIFILLALLASVILTTGESIQQIGPNVFLLAFFSLSLANVIPVNSGAMASTFVTPIGFRGMVSALLVILALLGIISYLVQGKTRGIQEYGPAAMGLASFLTGYALLILCDSWLFFFAGTALLFLGAWRYLDSIHRYYLWQ